MIPATIFTWNEPASLPRNLAGAISDIYIGATTDEAPTASPPMIRKKINKAHAETEAHPMAATINMTAMVCSTFLRPYFLAGMLANIAPAIVPKRLDDTVNPCHPELRCQRPSNVFSAPEITTVSNPNKKPPRAAMSAIRTGYDSILDNLLIHRK